MKDVLKTLGMHIRHFRTAAELSQCELARRAQLTKSYLSDVERGKANISAANLDKIAVMLQVPLHALLEGETVPEKQAMLALMGKMPDDALAALYRLSLMIPAKKAKVSAPVRRLRSSPGAGAGSGERATADSPAAGGRPRQRGRRSGGA